MSWASRMRIPIVVAALALGSAVPALALQAGITLDVHQDIQSPQLFPNDFHIEGLVCSSNGVMPNVVDFIIHPMLPNFQYTMTKMPGDNCWYWFEATWVGPVYIPYCTVIHLGVLFDVDEANIVINLIGWWTRDGVPVGRIIGSLRNKGFVPTLGFGVLDTEMPQLLVMGNGDPDNGMPPFLLPPVPPLPEPPQPPPWPPTPIPVQVLGMDLAWFPPGLPPPFAEMYEGGQQQYWDWTPVLYPDGEPISRSRPYIFQVDSFFDVFFNGPTPGGFGVAEPFVLPPGGFLVSRQLVSFLNNHGTLEERWFWEVHGAQAMEACCFPDGHCEDLIPFTCRQRGGLPMGMGTNCLQIICPQTELGACCYGDVAIFCAVTDPLTCAQQYFGQWKGPGTNCDDLNGNSVADICEEPEIGACCYEQIMIQCVVTDPLTCQMQFMGQWMGPGTNCDDLNGNGVADICETPELGACCWGELPPSCLLTTEAGCQQLPNGQWKGPGTNCDDLNGNSVADICEEPVQEEACCFEDGVCLMLPPPVCLLQGGQPMGAGSHCLGDLNGNGHDDLCEAKWLQLPDLHETGIDVKATMPLVLADDFLCTQQSLITEIVVWGSWYHDILPGGPENVRFTLSLHADIPDPDGQGPGYSMPGAILWHRTFVPVEFEVYQYQGNILEGWWDPSVPESYEFPGDTVCWMYFFRVPPHEAFCQRGTPDHPIVYWLDVQAEPISGPTLAQFGWKTSVSHWNDDAVWGLGLEPYPGPWQELRYPPRHPLHPQSVDLAFALGPGEPCPPPVCRGDCNCDGTVGFADIDLFVAGIPNNQANWAAKYQLYYGSPPPAGCWENCDVNNAGTHCGFDDIDPFVKLIPTPCAPRACCFPDHSCLDLVPGDCLIAGGQFFPGPGGHKPCSLTTCP